MLMPCCEPHNIHWYSYYSCSRVMLAPHRKAPPWWRIARLTVHASWTHSEVILKRIISSWKLCSRTVVRKILWEEFNFVRQFIMMKYLAFRAWYSRTSITEGSRSMTDDADLSLRGLRDLSPLTQHATIHDDASNHSES